MCRGYEQVSMEDFSETYSETFPSWGLMLDGEVFGHLGLEPLIDESEYSLWPTPTASDGNAWKRVKKTDATKSIQRALKAKPRKQPGQNRPIYYLMAKGYSPMDAASVIEMMMGFPQGWTDLPLLETR